MIEPNEPVVPAAERDLVITRVVDAPRALVFTAWTRPEHLMRWWGPNHFTAPVCELDVRPGGAILIHMRGPDGVIHQMTGAYREVVEPERIVFTSTPLDAGGSPLFEVLTTVTFTEEEGRTTLTMEARVLSATPAAAPYLAGMEPGWRQTLDRLGAYLATM